MRQLSVGVLAGGRNTGEHLNDILYQLNNRRYMKRLMGELGIFTEMLISDAKMGNFEELGPRVVYDAYGDIGPIDGICQILRQVSSPYVFVCAVDMPFISIDLVEYLAGYISEEYDCYVLADEERVHPLCAIYSKEVLPIIEELIAVDEVQPLIGLEYLIRIPGNLHQCGASRHQLVGKQIDERQIAKVAVIWDSDCLRGHKMISKYKRHYDH